MEEVETEIRSLNPSTGCPINCLPTKIIKENCDIFTMKVSIDFNNTVIHSFFLENLKLSDVIPSHKKDDKMGKTNYRPVSTIPSISKIYERLLYSQIETFIENILSHNQCGFRKGYSAQYCLIKMLEKWKSALDNKKHTGALLTDLSKAFDCINHDLMTAKLEAYGFDYKALKLIYSYLTNRSQRVKVNSEYSTWSRIQTGVP